MDEEWKAKRLQTLISQGVLVEDPDGVLWMSDRMKGLIEEFKENEKVKALIDKQAKDEEDYEKGCWAYLYVMHAGITTGPEVSEAVSVLMGWNKGARENRLDEWSMKLRFR